MTVFALLLVLGAALAHATWNLLLKRSGQPLIYTWNLCVAGTVVTLPIALYLLSRSTITPIGWGFFLGTAIIHAFYFTLLAQAYEHGDLSVVYPLAQRRRRGAHAHWRSAVSQRAHQPAARARHCRYRSGAAHTPDSRRFFA